MVYDVIIIGGGPAGLTAAIYAARSRLEILLLESYSVPAQAVLTDCIENYPGFPEGISGFELIDRIKKQAGRFGAEIKAEDVEKITEYKEGGLGGWKVETNNNSYTARSLIVATGASPKKLGVPGEERFKGKGVSYCATCDAAFYKDKEVVLAGGGNSAIEEALYLTRFVKKVSVVHRRDRLRAVKVLQEKAFKNKKIEFLLESSIIKILGQDKVTGIKVKNVKTDEVRKVPCEGVFVFVGYMPNTGLVKTMLELDNNGYILADAETKTSARGVFACGDCRKKMLRQVVTACGDGATAAYSAQQYVEELKGTAYK